MAGQASSYSSTKRKIEWVEPLDSFPELEERGCCHYCSRIPLHSLSYRTDGKPPPVYTYPLDTVQNILSNPTGCPICSLVSEVLLQCYSLASLQLPRYASMYMRICLNYFHLSTVGIRFSNRVGNFISDFAFETERESPDPYSRCPRFNLNLSIRPSQQWNRNKGSDSPELLDITRWRLTSHSVPHEESVDFLIRAFTDKQIASGELNASLFRKWIDDCLHNHLCLPPTTSDPGWPKIKVIDVLTREVVHLPDGAKYVALSYVWGTDSMANPDHRPTLGLDHVINPDTIPKTIQDTIDLTSQIGERYMWVDVYCIDQSDVHEKQSQINRMDEIFRGALVTVVALTSPNSASGLLSKASRRRQMSWGLENIEIRATYLPDVEKTVNSAIWNTRGWTMQEALLSKRRLFIADDQIFMTCEEDTYHDYASAPFSKLFGVTRKDLSPFNRDSNLMNFDIAAMEWDNRTMGALFGAYSVRNLSYDSDALNAFQGILNQLSKRTGKEFVYAVPIDDIFNGICWEPRGETQRRPGFPSWTWLGWQGEITFGALQKQISGGSLYKYPKTDEGVLVFNRDTPAVPEMAKILWARGNELCISSTCARLNRNVGESLSSSSYSSGAFPRIPDMYHGPMSTHPDPVVEYVLVARWAALPKAGEDGWNNTRGSMSMDPYHGDVVWAIQIERVANGDGRAERRKISQIPTAKWDAGSPRPAEIILV